MAEINVTEAMITRGIAALDSLSFAYDKAFIVRTIYTAMQLEAIVQSDDLLTIVKRIDRKLNVAGLRLSHIEEMENMAQEGLVHLQATAAAAAAAIANATAAFQEMSDRIGAMNTEDPAVLDLATQLDTTVSQLDALSASMRQVGVTPAP